MDEWMDIRSSWNIYLYVIFLLSLTVCLVSIGWEYSSNILRKLVGVAKVLVDKKSNMETQDNVSLIPNKSYSVWMLIILNVKSIS